MATRESSGKVLNALAKNIPWLLGGSADWRIPTKQNLTFEALEIFMPKNSRSESALWCARNGMARRLTG